MTYHRWTDADIALMREMHEQRHTNREIAAAIGTTPMCVNMYRSQYGLTRHRATCIVCHRKLQARNAVGRAREFCSASCSWLLNQAYAMNDRIDGRVITHCLNCGGNLIPPWTRKRKWCSRMCGQEGWYISVITDDVKLKKARARTALAMQRRRALNQLSKPEEDWLYTLRVDGQAPPYWCAKLRKKLDLRSTKALIKYARQIEVWS